MMEIDTPLRAAGVASPLIERWRDPLQAAAERNDIDSDARLIPWLATLVHESAHFTKLEEDLRYRAETLLRLFPLTPRRPWGFTPQDAADYALRPEAIANRIYADRMGNGNEASGEGWLYRGRGPIQITGRDNYEAASEPCEVDLLAEPARLLDPDAGALSAGWFWRSRHCNALADVGNLEGIRRVVNGGTIGLDEFIAIVNRMRTA